MKRAFLVMACCAFAFVCSAQSRFDKSLEVVYQKSSDDLINSVFGLEFVGMYNLVGRLSVGAGIGINAADCLYWESKSGMAPWVKHYRTDYVVPVYAAVRYDFSAKAMTPYALARFGYAIDPSGDPDANVAGPLAELGVGMSIPVGDGNALRLSAAFASRRSCYYLTTDHTEGKVSDIYSPLVSLRVGYAF